MNRETTTIKQNSDLTPRRLIGRGGVDGSSLRILTRIFSLGNKRRRQRGITLVEVSIVLVVILILSGIAYFVAQGTAINARAAALVQSVGNAETAIELSNIQTGCQPTNLSYLNAPATSNNSCGTASVEGWKGPYIRSGKFNGTILDLESIQEDTELHFENTITGNGYYLRVVGNSDLLEEVRAEMCGSSTPTISDRTAISLSINRPCVMVNGSPNAEIFRQVYP